MRHINTKWSISQRFHTSLLAFVAAVTLFASGSSAIASASTHTLSATQTVAGMSIDPATFPSTEWTYDVTTTALANEENVPANASLVFDYKDINNYYYANFSVADSTNLSGVYQVTNGVATRLISFAGAHIAANQSYSLELRKRSGAVKVYMGSTYLVKINDTSTTAASFGIGSISSSATFSAMSVQVGTTTTAINPVAVAGGVTSDPTNPTPPTTVDPNPTNPNPIVLRQIAVSTSAQLTAAMADAQAGDQITMADGIYSGATLIGKYTGSMAAKVSGTADMPITLIGGRGAIIDGNGTGGRYGLYLNGANYWNLTGFTVANAAKGIVLDGSNHITLSGIKVTNIGQEAVHFRAFSSYNILTDSEITGTGKNSPQYGEGVYIGSANSNWATYSNGIADASNYNQVIGNSIVDTGAENIDIKEGSQGGLIQNNTFDGSSIQGKNSADSWIDAKGNNYTIIGNTGNNTLLDGFQVHSAYAGWGYNNVFKNNTANVNAAGYGFNLVNETKTYGNIIYCSNIVTGAGLGFANVACTQD